MEFFIIIGFVIAMVVVFVTRAAGSAAGRKQHRRSTYGPRPQSRLYYSDSGRRVWWQR